MNPSDCGVARRASKEVVVISTRHVQKSTAIYASAICGQRNCVVTRTIKCDADNQLLRKYSTGECVNTRISCVVAHASHNCARAQANNWPVIEFSIVIPPRLPVQSARAGNTRIKSFCLFDPFVANWRRHDVPLGNQIALKMMDTNGRPNDLNFQMNPSFVDHRQRRLFHLFSVHARQSHLHSSIAYTKPVSS